MKTIMREKEGGMVTMVRKGLKRGACFVVIVVVIMNVVAITNAEDSRRSLDMNQAMETGMISNREVEIGGKFFDICVNQARKTITIKGYVDDWDEMDQVENYFRNRGPANYQVISQLDFAH